MAPPLLVDDVLERIVDEALHASLQNGAAIELTTLQGLLLVCKTVNEWCQPWIEVAERVYDEERTRRQLSAIAHELEPYGEETRLSFCTSASWHYRNAPLPPYWRQFAVHSPHLRRAFDHCERFLYYVAERWTINGEYRHLLDLIALVHDGTVFQYKATTTGSDEDARREVKCSVFRDITEARMVRTAISIGGGSDCSPARVGHLPAMDTQPLPYFAPLDPPDSGRLYQYDGMPTSLWSRYGLERDVHGHLQPSRHACATL